MAFETPDVQIQVPGMNAPITGADSSPVIPGTNMPLPPTQAQPAPAAPDLGNPSTAAPGGFGQKLSDALTAAAAQPSAKDAINQPGGFAKLFLGASLDALAKDGKAPHGLGVGIGIGGDAGSNLSPGQGVLAGVAKAQREVAALKQQKLENAQKVQTMNMEQQKTAAQLEQIHQQTIMNQRAIYKANEEDRKAHISDGAGVTKGYEDAGYDVERDISQAELEQRHQKDLELEKQNPKAVTYASQHQIIQTGENPVIGADGKEKVDKDGHTIYSPVYSAINIADHPTGTGMVEVTPEMSKSFKDNLGLDVPAGTKVPGLALSYSIVQNQGIANSYRLIRRANGGDLDAAKKDQVRIDVQDPAVQMGLASVPGRPIRGLNNMASSLQTAINGTPAVTDANEKVTKAAVPGLQAQVAALQQLQKTNPNDPRLAGLPDLQKHLADAQEGLQKVNRVLTTGFNEAAEKDEIAAQKTDEKDAQDRARDAETARHNKAEEANKAAEIAQKKNDAVTSNLTGDDYLQTLPTSQRSTVQAVGEGRQFLPANRKEALALLEQVHQAYPDFDEHKVKDWQKATTEYGSGKTGQGLVRANTAMAHAKALYDETTADAVLNPFSKAHNDREITLGLLNGEIGAAVKGGVVTQEEGKELLSNLSGGLTVGAKRERIAEVTRRLHDRIEEQQTQYAALAPSSATKVRSLISPQAADAYDYVQSGGKTQPTHQQAAQPQAQQPSAQSPAQQGPPGSTHPMKSADGKTTIYLLNNQWVTADGQPYKQ